MNENQVLDECGQLRDRRGEWRSGRPVHQELVFVWPPQPQNFARFLFGFPGYIFPWLAFYVAISAAAYFWLTPDLASMKSFAPGWVIAIWLRNAGLLFLFAGALHLWLYRLRRQGRKLKYNGDWMARKDKRFLFTDQVYDNVFWSVVSGCTFWTAYEAGLWWGYANELLPYVDPRNHPFWFGFWLLLIPIWRLFHFYWIHRLIHWPPLYRAAHYLHHKNVNIGPWSGMSMHPVEHLLYFSCMLIHLVVPSHPIHMLFNGLHTGLTPAQGHSGFDAIMLGEKRAIENEQLMHYLHHRHFTVNFGESIFPLDCWFGSFHDGTPEGDEAMRRARKPGRAG